MNSREVLAYTPGLTYRKLDYWTRAGYLPDAPVSHGSGADREWTPRHRAILVVMVRLVGAGMEPAAASKIAAVAVPEGAFTVESPTVVELAPGITITVTHVTPLEVTS